MILEMFGYYDPDERMTKCIAEKGAHGGCKEFKECFNGRPCMHFRDDLNKGCDCPAIQFEAWAAAKK